MILQNCRDPKDEFASSAVERDTDTTLGSRGRRQHTANLGIMARSNSLRAGNDDVGAIVVAGVAGGALSLHPGSARKATPITAARERITSRLRPVVT